MILHIQRLAVACLTVPLLAGLGGVAFADGRTVPNTGQRTERINCPHVTPGGIPRYLLKVANAADAVGLPPALPETVGRQVDAYVRPANTSGAIFRVVVALDPTVPSGLPGEVVDPITIPDVMILMTEDAEGGTLYLKGYSTDARELYIAVTGRSASARRDTIREVARATFARPWRCPVRGLPGYLEYEPDIDRAVGLPPALPHRTKGRDTSAFLAPMASREPIKRVVATFQPTAPVGNPGAIQDPFQVSDVRNIVTDDSRINTMFVRAWGTDGRELWLAVTGSQDERRTTAEAILRKTYAERW